MCVYIEMPVLINRVDDFRSRELIHILYFHGS